LNPQVAPANSLDPGARERLEGRVWPAVIVGAGAAGLLAAIFAGRGGLAVLLLEAKRTPGAKIRVSGGGRCNLLPSEVELRDFHTHGSKHALRNALFSWPLDEVRAFFERELATPLVTEPTGKVFPASQDPRQVVAALLGECARVGVELAGGRRVIAVRRVEGVVPGGARFEVEIEDGRRVSCRRLVLATGGLSLPKTGSDGGGFELARSLGHSVPATYPALVPLLAADARWGELAGLSLRARLAVERQGRRIEEREGDLLFTHRGFSGPLALDLSHHFTEPGSAGTELVAHWLGERGPPWDLHLRRGGRKSAAGLLREELPRRLADLLIELAGVDPERRASELTRAERLRLVEVLERCKLALSGDEGYRTAEVTGGGVPLAELATRTLESLVAPGLYLAGEMVDATGRIGGYNFLWAWVSGRKVGLALAAAGGSPVP